MTTNDTYLAVFLGSKASPRMKAWTALPETERRAKQQEGMAAWKAWVEKHHAGGFRHGRAARQDEEDHGTRHRGREQRDGRLHGRAGESHEAAARLFEKHPAFHDLSGQVRRDHAGSADTKRLIGGNASSSVNS